MNYLLIFIYFFFTQPQAETNTLTVTIENITDIEGTLEIGLFDSGERFLEEGQALRTISVDVKSTSETIVIKNLKKGTYAVSLYHDVNSDDTCNLNFFGIPKEPYAFSNNFKPKFSAPKFEDCEFEINSNKSITIQLL